MGVMLNRKCKVSIDQVVRLFLLLLSVCAGGVYLEQGATTLNAARGIVLEGRAAESFQTSPQRKELLEFSARCHEPSVLVCQGFDTSADYIRAKWPSSGLYPAADEILRGTMDTSVKASGKASLRFEIPSHSPANAAGSWRQGMGREFGEGSTFYVQFRQRFSKELLKNNWGDTSWKQVIFHNAGATCADVELTTGQYYRDGFPIMYTDCGGRLIATNAGIPPYKLEQGDYNCWYGEYNAKNCFLYPVDQWVTFYYQISIGHWGKPDSSIQAWTALDGQTYKQWIKMPNFILKNENPGKDYDTVTLLTYMTSKSLLISQPIAYTWYDELIVSTAPIAPPAASGQDSKGVTASPQ
jgi:hypothetical protein